MSRELLRLVSHLLRLAGVIALAFAVLQLALWILDSQSRGLSLVPLLPVLTAAVGAVLFVGGASLARRLPRREGEVKV